MPPKVAKEGKEGRGVGKDKKSWGDGGFFGNRELGALALIVLTPLLVFPFWFLCARFNGDLSVLEKEFHFSTTGAGRAFLIELWHEAHPMDIDAWKIISCYMAFELVLQRWMPGKEFHAEGARTVSGRVPKYVANGVQSYIFTIICLFALRYDWAQPAEKQFLGFNPAVVYDKMGHLLSCSNVLALALCTFLTFKGLYFPSTRESGTNGNLIIDFFWGTDLYPNILGWDVKQFTNCRFGMMFWQVGILCYAMKQFDLQRGVLDSAMVVSVLLQTVYIAKFFWWETGYFQSMDIQHDRAGYYICWGCMVWVPSVYTMHTLFLVRNPQFLSPEFAAAYTIMGVFCIWCNYDCDRQRQEFRQTGGRMKIWGREPVFIEAKYDTKDHGTRTSLLLADGWWGLSRHFHYIPEIMASVFWCVPAQYGALYLGFLPMGLMPYFYPFYLTLLLIDRAWRDDKRCADKYKEYWAEYCRAVPFKIIPGVI